MKSAVLVFPGINREARYGAGAEARLRPRARRWSGTPRPSCRQAPISWCCPAASPTAIICAAARLRRARRSWTRCAPMRRKGGLVLGICNGFQILCESGLLPGILMRNANLKFICRDVHCASSAPTRLHARLQCQGQVIRRPRRAWRGQLHRRRRDADAARRRRAGDLPLFAMPDGTHRPQMRTSTAR